jgi:hypothetical protein
MPKGPFDDELSPEEEALLNDPNAVPPSEEDGETVETAVAEAGQTETPAVEQPKTEEAPAATETPAAATPTPSDEEAENAAFAEFLERNKDKSPEELARLAFQQQKRANREAAENRTTRDRVNQVAERARTIAAQRDQARASLPELQQQFREKLAADPDAAVAELFDKLQNEKVAKLDEAARSARLDEAVVFADQHIPEFNKQWPEMHGLAKEFGFTDQELDAIDDGRTLVMLSLANHAARLIKGGLMDSRGNLTAGAMPTTTPVDPRLAAPNPQPTLGNGRGGAKTNPSVAEQLQAMLDMPEEEFAKLDPKVVEDLMRKAA